MSEEKMQSRCTAVAPAEGTSIKKTLLFLKEHIQELL